MYRSYLKDLLITNYGGSFSARGPGKGYVIALKANLTTQVYAALEVGMSSLLRRGGYSGVLYGVAGTHASRGLFSWLTGERSHTLPPLVTPFHGVKLPQPLSAYVETSTTPAASIGLYVECGSINETPYSSGATHLLERMAFKSTMNRSHLRIVREVEALRGNVTASAIDRLNTRMVFSRMFSKGKSHFPKDIMPNKKTKELEIKRLKNEVQPRCRVCGRFFEMNNSTLSSDNYCQCVPRFVKGATHVKCPGCKCNTYIQKSRCCKNCLYVVPDAAVVKK